MTHNGRSLPFVRVTHERNRTPTGRRSRLPARQAARYFAFGKDREAEQAGRQRGEWYGPGGRPYTHQQVSAWAEGQALAHEYTFQALLSVPEGRMQPADFGRALEAAGDEQLGSWRLLAHDDTDYSHAHVLFFRDERMDKEAFADWHDQIREELAALEAQRLDGVQMEYDVALEVEGGLEL